MQQKAVNFNCEDVIKSDGFKSMNVVILRSISIPNFMAINLKNIKVRRFRNANMVQKINFKKYKFVYTN